MDKKKTCKVVALVLMGPTTEPEERLKIVTY